MRYRFTGAVVAMAIAVAVTLSVMPTAGQAQNPARIDGHPNLNGVWQAMNTAYWNLEDHSAAGTQFWQLGAMFAIPAGQSVIEGGSIPYLPQALERREALMADWPATDPEAKCYMAGIPRSNYMPYPFQIVQGNKDILFVYEFASSNRIVHMDNHEEPPVDSWMGWSNGRWDGDTLVVDVTGQNEYTWFDRAGNFHSEAMRVTERWTPSGPNHLLYEATIEDPKVFARPWKMSFPIYRRLEPNLQLIEFNCVPFVEEMMYDPLGLYRPGPRKARQP
jgi:hypothetical protein